jgi:hypothetical protein
MVSALTPVSICLFIHTRDGRLHVVTQAHSWWWLIVHTQPPSGFNYLRQGPKERLHQIVRLAARIMILGDVFARTLINPHMLYFAVHPSCTVHTNILIVAY